MSTQFARLGALLLCLHAFPTTASAQSSPVVIHDLDVQTDTGFIRGTDVSVYVSVTGATDLTERHALAGADVRVSLAKIGEAGRGRPLAQRRTRADGTAVVNFAVPRALSPGSYSLVVYTRSAHGEGEYRQPVEVRDAEKLHVRTDRGIYRPGHTLRWRVTAVNAANAHPRIGAEIEVAIKDPHGTAIWSGKAITGRAGMIHGAVPLDQELVLGTYTVVAHMGDEESQTQVKVRAYRVPAFEVSVQMDDPGPYQPGATVKGHVLARYLQGEPVSGRVQLSGSGLRLTAAETTLDDHGRMPFTAELTGGGTRARISASVTDGAMRTHRAQRELAFAGTDLQLEIIPERRQFLPGVRQYVTVVTTDGQGHFAPAEISVAVAGRTREVWSSPGAVRVPVTPKATDAGSSLALSVHAKAGALRAHERDTLTVGAASERLIRPENAVVPGGSAVAVTGVWQKPQDNVVITMLRHGTPVASSVAKVDRQGRLRAHLQPPPGVFGLVTLRATDARYDSASGAIKPVHAQATVYLRPTALDVAIRGQTRHRPGQRAKLDVEVRDRIGRPLADAGLAASVVDERVLLLAEPGPDLVTALRELGMGRAKAAGLAFADLLTREQSPAHRLAMRAMIERLPPDTTTPDVHIAAAARIEAEVKRLIEVRRAVYKTLLTDHRPIGKHMDSGWEFAHPLDRLLTRAGWKKSRRDTPWRNTVDWTYARRLQPTLTFADMAPDIATERLDRLARQVRKNRKAFLRERSLKGLLARGKLARYLGVDPWGTPIDIVAGYVSSSDHRPSQPPKHRHMFSAVSAGPDRAFSTDDDIAYADLLQVSAWGTGSAYGYGRGGMGSRGIALPGIRTGARAVPSEDLAVRRNFDQTVLWQAGVQTDASGRYTFEVPLADSVTGWRVEVTALGPKGAVGRARTRLETALPLYMDVQLPYALTVGDVYQLPVVLANHSDAAKTLAVHANVSGSLRAIATPRPHESGQLVTLPAGTTTMVPIGIRAHSIGQGSVELRLTGADGRAVDATRHTLEVAAPGRLERAIRTAAQRDDRLQISLDIPRDHTPATAKGVVRLYRGVADQAVDGLEGLLREPHGCFEQTSSTTYPNLLVLRLLGEEEEHEATRARAIELVGKGYQRLISYEVPGGGFSWFGDAPANQVLTAYGLMEFVDMAEVYPVDGKLIERTRAWILGKQNKDGSWTKDESWLHDWSAVQGAVSTTAYIAWALAESGYRGPALKRAFRFLRRHRQALEKDAYLLSLWAAGESAASGGKKHPALAPLRRKIRRGDDGVYLPADQKTLFYAKGKGADAQVTALGVTALARARARKDVEGALAWLWQARDQKSGWGTTQGTVLALRAYALTSKKQADSGQLRVLLDGKKMATIDLAQPSLPTLDLPAGLSAGRHQVIVEPLADAGQPSPDLTALRADARLRWRTGPAKKPVQAGLQVTLTKQDLPVRVGESRDMTVHLGNPGPEVVAMPTVVIPVPPGFQAVSASLDSLERLPTVDRAEDQGSEIHIYLSKLDAGKQLDLPYRLEAAAACEVTQRSAVAYAYYDPETRGASAEHRLVALPRK